MILECEASVNLRMTWNLQDTALVFGLEDAKFTSDEVKEKVKIAQETEAKINLISQNYCHLDMDLDVFGYVYVYMYIYTYMKMDRYSLYTYKM